MSTATTPRTRKTKATKGQAALFVNTPHGAIPATPADAIDLGDLAASPVVRVPVATATNKPARKPAKGKAKDKATPKADPKPAKAKATSAKPKAPAVKPAKPKAKTGDKKPSRKPTEVRYDDAGKVMVSNGKGTNALLAHLLDAKAFNEGSAVDRATVWEHVAGLAVTTWLGKVGVVAVAVREDKSRGLYLTPEGRKLATQRQKEQAKAEAAEAK